MILNGLEARCFHNHSSLTINKIHTNRRQFLSSKKLPVEYLYYQYKQQKNYPISQKKH